MSPESRCQEALGATKAAVGRNPKAARKSNSGRRWLRSPDLLIYWDREGLVVKDLASRTNVVATPEILSVLDVFSRSRTPESAIRALPEYEAGSLLRAIRALRKLRLLLPEKEGRRKASRLKVWKGNLASAHYHTAARDMRYIVNPSPRQKVFREWAARARPPAFKRYDAAVRRRLGPPARERLATSLDEVLLSRRTVRRFARTPVRSEDLAAVVAGTWGRTGWIETDIVGRFATKTSPSAGALHPIECYVLAWNVSGLSPGLYHYDVGAAELRRLRSGNPRAEAVRAASGQRWVGGAAFLCVLTAVFTRSLWKYQQENAYRDVWLDAGHLGQTFCLLATARGLGPFTTVALQDSYIEKLIGLDGITEFPVYLCGAGVPTQPLLPDSR